MAKKQIFSDAEIEKDIVCALKKPPNESKKSYEIRDRSLWHIIPIFLNIRNKIKEW